MAVRVTRLTQDEADALHTEWGGYVGRWDDYWQWELAGKAAIAFLAEHNDEFALQVIDRESKP